MGAFRGIKMASRIERFGQACGTSTRRTSSKQLRATRMMAGLIMSTLLILSSARTPESSVISAIEVGPYIEGETYALCQADLAQADADGDGKVDSLEYLTFISLQSGGALNPNKFREVPLPLILVFYWSACACAQVLGAASMCCVGKNAAVTYSDFSDGAPTTGPILDFCVQSSDRINEVLAPTASPTLSPAPTSSTPRPTIRTDSPTKEPSVQPSAPTVTPSVAPSLSPSGAPSAAPVPAQSSRPTSSSPSTKPSSSPSSFPSMAPSAAPSIAPSTSPSTAPSVSPSSSPSVTPSSAPSGAPSASPSLSPSSSPSQSPSASPSSSPSTIPSTIPSASPSLSPSTRPSFFPSGSPSVTPGVPSVRPTTAPVVIPTSDSPTRNPTFVPTNYPSEMLTPSPTHAPTLFPKPSYDPTFSPTTSPTRFGTLCLDIAYGLDNDAGLDGFEIMNEINNTLKTGLIVATTTIVSKALAEKFPTATSRSFQTPIKAIQSKPVLQFDSTHIQGLIEESSVHNGIGTNQGGGRLRGRKLVGVENAVRRALQHVSMEHELSSIPLTFHESLSDRPLLRAPTTRHLSVELDTIEVFITGVNDSPCEPGDSPEKNCAVVSSRVCVLVTDETRRVDVRFVMTDSLKNAIKFGDFKDAIPKEFLVDV